MNKETKIIYSSTESLYKLLGLGFETIHIDNWVHEPNTNYIAVDDYCYTVIRSKIPLGLRGAQFWMVCMMNRVGLNDGSNYVFTYSDPESIEEAVNKVKSPDFEKPHPLYNVPEFELVTDIDRAVQVLTNFTNLPLGTWFGYDYESKSFPNCEDFIITGLGIATTDKMVFIDYRLCALNPKANYYEYLQSPDKNITALNTAHRVFLEKHGKHCIVFNVNFELIASYRYLGDFFDYRDLNCTNIMKQYGLWCNLKWTIRYLVNINSWDDKFEEFNSAFDPENKSDLPVAEFDENGNITKINYSNIQKRFDWISMSDLVEMQQHAKVSLNSFYIIPSRHLGYYCALDAYNTLIGWLIELPKWNYVDDPNNHFDIGERLDKLDRFPIEDRFKIMSEAGLDIYCDGKLAESIVNNGGQLLDSKFWSYGLNLCHRYILHAATHLGVYYCELMLDEYSDRNNLEDYSPIARRLISDGIDITVGGYYLSKKLIFDRYYDQNCEGSCDINKIYEDWGQEVGDEILEDIWYYVDTLDDAWNKRSIFTYVGEVMDRELKFSESLMEKHSNTINYYTYKTLLEWYKALPWYGTRVEDYKDEYVVNGNKLSLIACHDYLCTQININTCQSDILDRTLKGLNEDRLFLLARSNSLDWELEDLYPKTSYAEDKSYFFSDDATTHISEEYLKYLGDLINGDMYDATYDYQYKHLIMVNTFQYYYPEEYKILMNDVREGNADTKYKLLYINILWRMWAKYFKIKSYFEGTYYEQDDNYHTLDKYWIKDYFPNSEFDINHNVLAYPNFSANAQFSGRWSSNFHTVPSRNEVKKCTTSPDDAVFTYFDISSMEIRAIAYLSQDPKMVEIFESGQDVYKFCARFMLGDDYWNNLSDDDKADYRSAFKVVLLAYFYLRSAGSLAPELGKTVKETQEIMNSLARTFAEGIEFRDYLSQYPLKHAGRLLTVFNEWIESDEEPYRQVKHGINTVIQGSSAVMLVYGFYNLMRKTWAKGWKFRSIGYVHDSSQSYFDIRHLWEMRDHYYENVTQFLYDRFRVRFNFDIMCGTNYFEVSKLSQIAPDIIELKGCANSINSLMQRLRRNNINFEIVDADKYELVDGLLKPDVKDPLDDFIESSAFEATFCKDHSSYKVQLRKLD